MPVGIDQEKGRLLPSYDAASTSKDIIESAILWMGLLSSIGHFDQFPVGRLLALESNFPIQMKVFHLQQRTLMLMYDLLQRMLSMAVGAFVSYLRVSTGKQERSGHGLEAQRHAVTNYLNGGDWSLIKEFIEVESGKRSDRPHLDQALALCRIHNATLVIAKLDRLSRDAHFLLSLQKASVPFVACDMPNADNFTVGILAMLAQKEREMISTRTREALAAAKAGGKKLGGDRGNLPRVAKQGAAASRAIRTKKAVNRSTDLLSMIAPLLAERQSLGHIAKHLNEQGVPTARGGKWQATQVARVIAHAAKSKDGNYDRT